MGSAVFHLIPHTHWDREWYLPRAAFGVRLVAMMDELLPMLERHPELRFTLDGQTVLVEDYLSARPDARERVAALVRAGRLAIGPWYVLADEIIPSPAALRRNLAIGLEDAASLGGAMRVLYSPDAFGHPGWLPGLAQDAGLRWGVVWRGQGGDRAGGPDLLRWTGTDGRAILIHHLPPDGYEVGAHLPGARLGEAWPPLRDRLLARSLTRHVAVPVGSDHHAPHPELPRLAERLQRLASGHTVRFSRWEDYFEGAESESPEPPPVQGELRWSYGYTWTLQGVAATRARLKRAYSTAERWLALAERAGRREDEPGSGPTGERPDGRATLPLGSDWRTLVQCQFHDTLAGTVCDEAAREQAVRLEAVGAAGREVVREALLRRAGLASDERRAGGSAASVVIHPTRLDSWPGSARSPGAGVVTAPIDRFREDVPVGPPGGRAPRRARPARNFVLRRPDGEPVPYQLLRREAALHRADRRYGYPDLDRAERTWVAIDLGDDCLDRALTLTASDGRSPPVRPDDPVRVAPRTLENGAIRVTVWPDGSLRLVERATGERYEGLLAPYSEPDDGDLYTPWIRPEQGVARPEVLRVDRVAAGPLVGALAVHWRIESRRGTIAGRTTVALHAGSRLLRCRIDVDNGARQHRLRLRLPADVGGPARAYDGTGWVDRAPVRWHPSRFPSEWPVATAPAHGVVSVGGGRRGLAVSSPGFFEYEWTAAGELWVTVLRSVGTLSAGALPPRPGHAGWITPTPEALEPGLHRLELAIDVGAEPEAPPATVIALPVLGVR